MTIQDLINKVNPNLKLETMSTDEKETLMGWLKVYNAKPLTAEEIKSYIKALKEAAERDLVKMSMDRPSFWSFLFERKRRERLLARLENYMLLEAFVTSKDKAKEALENQISNLERGSKISV